MLLTDMTWPAIRALDKNVPVVIPIAAVEQHGHHLPMATDSMLLAEIVRRAEAAVGTRALFAPLQWLGNSHHHTDFPGTVSAPPRLYLDLLCELAENFLRHGFKRVLVLNGHGGNSSPGKQAVFELRQKYRHQSNLLLLSCAYWDLAVPELLGPDFVQKQMGHACEWETSMILRLAPQLVAQDVSTLQSIPFDYGFDPAYRGWITKDRSTTGHIGSPQFATEEKGERLFATFSAGAVTFITSVAEWDGSSWI